jgi:melibiose permease/lactose/raffinose/galactose permease
MLAALVSLYLMFYLTEVPTSRARAGRRHGDRGDARLRRRQHYIMGVVVDNTRSRWGKFKRDPGRRPGARRVLMFADLGIDGWATWCCSRPSTSPGVVARSSQHRPLRDRGGSCPSPTGSGLLGDARTAWFALAVALVVIMLAFQSLTLIFTRRWRPPGEHSVEGAVLRHRPHDQLLWVTRDGGLHVRLHTTTSFGLHYFKYYFRDEAPTIFAAILSRSRPWQCSRWCESWPRPHPSARHRDVRRRIRGVLVSGTNLLIVGAAGVLCSRPGPSAAHGDVHRGLRRVRRVKLGAATSPSRFAQPLHKLSNAIASGVVGSPSRSTGRDPSMSARRSNPQNCMLGLI